MALLFIGQQGWVTVGGQQIFRTNFFTNWVNVQRRNFWCGKRVYRHMSALSVDPPQNLISYLQIRLHRYVSCVFKVAHYKMCFIPFIQYQITTDVASFIQV